MGQCAGATIRGLPHETDRRDMKCSCATAVLAAGWLALLVSGLNCSAVAAAEPTPNARPPRDDDDLRFWLQNMVWHHRFTTEEIRQATGLDEARIAASLERFGIEPGNRPERDSDAPPLVLPYPGGRHPRIGFLDGAIDPQRETKISVFAPWDADSYVVVDVPEAIWSNLGLTYLAHTHVPTIWSLQGVELPRLEWQQDEGGRLRCERRLPNGIEFGTTIVPQRDAVRMEMWLTNGAAVELTGLRVQNCVMLKGCAGFTAQSNDNKQFRPPYVTCRSENEDRWIITGWEPCQRAWGNEACPCLHADPQFPDLAPGKTGRLRGWLSFYQGDDIDEELARIEATGWRTAEFVEN
jgi:hypothetical protein